MNRDHVTTGLILALLLALFYLFGKMLLPFLTPVVWAGALALLFRPLYLRLLKPFKNRNTLTALVVTLIILVVLIGPIAYLTAALVDEAADAVNRVNTMYESGQLQQYLTFDLPLINSLKEKLSRYYDFSQIDINEIVRSSIDRFGKFVIDQAGEIISNGTKAIFYFILMLVSVYYFLKDGDKLVDWLRSVVPLPRERVDKTFAHLGEVVSSTITSGLLVALLQGVLGGILFAAVGLPSPIFWGAVMAFLSLLPVIGAFIIYIPAGVVLLISGSTAKGIVVLVIGLGVISQLDNFLRPKLMANKTALHPLLLFFAIMGGIAAFGFTGMILGPMVVAAFVTLAGERG